MSIKTPVYLDNHSTTPCDPRVVESMIPTFSELFGNASSIHHDMGSRAKGFVEEARAQVARLINCQPKEIVFTSGATESNNLALKGVALNHAQSPSMGHHILTSCTEHKAVLDSCQRLENQGFQVTYLPVAPDGRIQCEDVDRAIRKDTILVSIMHANNEIGVINPVKAIGTVCKNRGVLFHCDAVQSLAYLPCDVQDLGIDLLSISAHKIYGPKGIGALYVRTRTPRVRLLPLIDGGGHERGLRSGTLNVSGIVGLGTACDLIFNEREKDVANIGLLRDRLFDKIKKCLPDTHLNGSREHRLPNNLNLSFPGVVSETLLRSLKTLALSSGSACTSASYDGSYVLKALPGCKDLAGSSIRIGLGKFNTEEEIDFAASEIIKAVNESRQK